MDILLYKVLARVAAVYLAAHLVNNIRSALAKREVPYISPGALETLFADWSKLVARRDVTPIRYWLIVSSQIMVPLAACLYVAAFGWWRPGA